MKKEIEKEREKADTLLQEVLPHSVAAQVRAPAMTNSWAGSPWPCSSGRVRR